MKPKHVILEDVCAACVKQAGADTTDETIRVRRELPLVDEPEITVDAPVERVWQAVEHAIPGRRPSPLVQAFGRALAVIPCASSVPSELDAGTELHGFRVARWEPGREVLLEGRHRFSRYTLRFSLDRIDQAHSVVRAETRAEFPGAAGFVYRALVIGSGAHAKLMQRMLASIKRRAEAQ